MLDYFKSIVDMERASIVICDLTHTIIYMNPAAKKNYAKHGDLVGKSLLACHNDQTKEIILRVIDWFASSKDNNMIYTFHNDKQNKDVYMVALRNAEGKLIGYYEKHEYRDRETAERYDFSRSLV